MIRLHPTMEYEGDACPCPCHREQDPNLSGPYICHTCSRRPPRGPEYPTASACAEEASRVHSKMLNSEVR